MNKLKNIFRNKKLQTPELQAAIMPAKLLLLYSIVSRTYETPDKKLEVYLELTDSYFTIPIGRNQRDKLLNVFLHHERYEVAFEQYSKPTGDIHIDAYKPKEDLTLQSTSFYHIFIKSNAYGEIFNDFKTDRKLHFFNRKQMETQ